MPGGSGSRTSFFTASRRACCWCWLPCWASSFPCCQCLADIPQVWCQFIWRAEWDIVNEEFGAAIAIVETIVSAGIYLLDCDCCVRRGTVPDGNLPRLAAPPLGTAVELLAAVPSIIYGMFGLFVFAPLFADYFQMPVQKLLGGMPLVGFCLAAA